jgi:hypothetical protein
MTKKFLIEHNLTLGTETSLYVNLYSIVEAPDYTAAEAQVAHYGDPAYKIRVNNITELGDTLKTDELYRFLAHHKVVRTNPLFDDEKEGK